MIILDFFKIKKKKNCEKKFDHPPPPKKKLTPLTPKKNGNSKILDVFSISSKYNTICKKKKMIGLVWDSNLRWHRTLDSESDALSIGPRIWQTSGNTKIGKYKNTKNSVNIRPSRFLDSLET